MACGDAKCCLRTMIEKAPISLLVTNVPNGAPAVRPMGTVLVDDDFVIWYATGRSADKCRQIEADSRVTVYWQAADPTGMWDYGHITGTAELLDTPELRDRFWTDEWNRYFPGGKGDPELVLIKVTPQTGVCHHMPDWATHTTTF